MQLLLQAVTEATVKAQSISMLILLDTKPCLSVRSYLNVRQYQYYDVGNILYASYLLYADLAGLLVHFKLRPAGLFLADHSRNIILHCALIINTA